VLLPPPPARAAPRAGEPLEVLFVLDVSGSMARTTATGETLLDGAKQALGQVSARLPDEIAVGLRTYGAAYAGDDRARSCADTRLEVRPEPASDARIGQAMAALRPLGGTPIGRALDEAVGDFSAGPGQRVVVLVSDGQDTCQRPAPTPCQAARAVARTDPRVRVESVGLALQGQRRAVEALRCVSEATGGDYYSADDSQALAAALGRIAEGTIQRLGPGRKVTGSQAPELAPTLTPGAYRDTIDAGSSRWYRFAVTEGQTPQVSATVKGIPGLEVPYDARSCETWQVQLYNPYGEGGTYEPYGTTNVFDGSGLAAGGASAIRAAHAGNDGIDFPGTWSLRLSLATAEDVLDSDEGCARHLAGRSFDLRVRLQLQGAGAPATAPSAAATPAPSPAPAETAPAETAPAETLGPDELALVAPDRTQTTTETGPGSSTTLVGLALVVVSLGGLAYLLLRIRRRRLGD